MHSIPPRHHWNAHLYSDKHAYVFEAAQALVALLDPQPGERILDVGCGTGELTHAIAERGADTLGIDASAAMIRSAQSRYPALPFEAVDLLDFQADAPFDAVFSNACLHWIRDSLGAARRLYAALKPGGRLVVEFGGAGNVQEVEGALRQVLAQYGHGEAAVRELWYFPSLGSYTSLLEEAGFHVRTAAHFPRETRLADTRSGLSDWLAMFAATFFAGLGEAEVAQMKQDIETRLRPTRFHDGHWYADYKRLRVTAIKAHDAV